VERSVGMVFEHQHEYQLEPENKQLRRANENASAWGHPPTTRWELPPVCPGSPSTAAESP